MPRGYRAAYRAQARNPRHGAAITVKVAEASASILGKYGQAMTDPKYMRPGLRFAVGKVVEELGELQAALGKTIRWGWFSSNPELPAEQRETKLAWVRREIADVREALDHLEREIEGLG